MTVYLVAIYAAGIMVAGIFMLPVVGGANDGSRWATVWSLLEGRGYCIDKAPYSTCDKIMIDGKFYSSKPPLLPTLVAGIAWPVKSIASLNLLEKDGLVMRLVLVIINVIPYIVFIVMFARMIAPLCESRLTFIYSVIAAGLGTYLLSYNMSFNNHTPAAICVFLGIYYFDRIINQQSISKTDYWLCALFSSLAVVGEVHAGLLPVAFAVLLARRDLKASFYHFLPVAGIVGLLYCLANFIATGGPLPAYTTPSFYQYPGSYWDNPGGIDALQEPKWLYALNMLIGHHGIFSLTPIFLISLYGLFKRRLSVIEIVGCVLTFIDFIFILFKTSNYGGVCQGPRWFFWLIPFWLVMLPRGVSRLQNSRLAQAVCMSALAVSLFSSFFPLLSRGPWQSSWLHLLFRGWLIDY